MAILLVFFKWPGLQISRGSLSETFSHASFKGGRKRDSEECSPSGYVPGLDGAAALFHYAMGDGKPKSYINPSSLGLCGKEGVEDSVYTSGRYARSSVPYLY